MAPAPDFGDAARCRFGGATQTLLNSLKASSAVLIHERQPEDAEEHHRRGPARFDTPIESAANATATGRNMSHGRTGF